MSASTILIVGAHGMLGRALAYVFNKHGFFVQEVSRSQYDIEKDAVAKLKITEGATVINAAGLTNRRLSTAQESSFLKINSIFPRVLADHVESQGAHLIHVSTDCVFSGRGGHNEEDIPNATDLYGYSKALGEPRNALVIRTSIIGPERARADGLMCWFLSQEGSVQGYENHQWNGLTTIALSEVFVRMVQQGFQRTRGVRHIYGEAVSKLTLLQGLQEHFAKKISIVPTITPQPVDRRLSTLYAEEMKQWQIQPLDTQLADLRAYCDPKGQWTAKPLTKRPPPAIKPKKLTPERRATLWKVAGQTYAEGRLQESRQAFEELLAEDPRNPELLSNLGVILRRTGFLTEAIESLKKALEIKPNHVPALANLCNVYRQSGQLLNAIDTGKKALALSPDDVNAATNLGFALFLSARYDEARTVLEHAVAIDPLHSNAWNNLGNIHQSQSRIPESIDCYEKALRADPNNIIAHSNILFNMHFSPAYTPDEIARAHKDWARRHEAPIRLQALPERPARAGRTRLRVGMISADFREHPVAYFLKPLIRHWDHSSLDLCLYGAVGAKDQTTEWFRSQSDQWRDVIGLNNRELAQVIRDDEIDVLFDLTGHTADHRLLALAYRPATIQAIWLGYFDTSGMQSVDFLLADPICFQPGEEARFSEQVLCLPNDFLCFDPPQAPAVADLPAQRNGYVTFGSQNQIVKITDEVIDLWVRVLETVEGSRLLVAGKAFNDASTQETFRSKFISRGLDPSRLTLKAGDTRQGVLNTYNQIDIALDSFPCAGGTTTCEALWMGVPVISLYGDRFGGRHSASHLIATGLREMVTYNKDDYVRLAGELATNLDRLASLRSGLRVRMLESPLCDGKTFAKDFDAAIWEMWNRHTSQPTNG